LFLELLVAVTRRNPNDDRSRRQVTLSFCNSAAAEIGPPKKIAHLLRFIVLDAATGNLGSADLKM